MKSKKIIIDKTTYGGTLVDKYFFIFDDGSDEQVSPSVWDWYEVGNEYPREIPKSFDDAMEDIREDRTITLDKALNEKLPIDWKEMYNKWKEMHDMQQKLVTHYILENEKLKDKIRALEEPSDKVDKICKEIEKIYNENIALKKLIISDLDYKKDNKS